MWPSSQADWSAQVDAVLAPRAAPGGLPGFDLHTLLPQPEVFDGAITTVESAATAMEAMGGELESELEAVAWQGADADAFRQRLTGTRAPRLAAQAGELRDLAGELRAAQARVAAEIEWIKEIERRVRDFLAAVAAAFEAARATAAIVLAEAQQAEASLASAGLHGVIAGGSLVEGLVDEATGGDGRDELRRAAEHRDAMLGDARAAVDDARAACEAVVDFTTGWTFNHANLPTGPCRAWYDADDFCAAKSASPEAYGVVYVPMGRLQ